MFRRSYIQISLENLLFYVKNLNLSVSGKLQCTITAFDLSSFRQRSDEFLSWRVFRHLSVHNLPKSVFGLHYMSDHRRIVPTIQEYDTICLNSNPPEFGVSLGLFQKNINVLHPLSAIGYMFFFFSLDI